MKYFCFFQLLLPALLSRWRDFFGKGRGRHLHGSGCSVHWESSKLGGAKGSLGGMSGGLDTFLMRPLLRYYLPSVPKGSIFSFCPNPKILTQHPPCLGRPGCGFRRSGLVTGPLRVTGATGTSPKVTSLLNAAFCRILFFSSRKIDLPVL